MGGALRGLGSPEGISPDDGGRLCSHQKTKTKVRLSEQLRGAALDALESRLLAAKSGATAQCHHVEDAKRGFRSGAVLRPTWAVHEFELIIISIACLPKTLRAA